MDHNELGKSASELKEEIIRLGPWHLNVQVTPEVSTAAFLEAPEGTYPSSGPKDPRRISFLNTHDHWVNTMGEVYPEGLEGRSFMECACNCGAYCFFAKELGAGETFGFDVRDHWVDRPAFCSRTARWHPRTGCVSRWLTSTTCPGWASNRST